ncbi:hypothetical protein B6U90_03630 [Thermoplasmatales archaeon ex4484_6]|nr:MAG: hypothetical protein B6U90_03630 [Thermoplasmatales archaeon ex4484_6]RLF69508.1 MAG: hypothetical protein DRN57_00580 [Thermoplasmata archaeon]
MRRREPAIPLMIRDILLSSEDTSPIDDGPRTHFITPTGAYVYRTVISGVLMEKDDIGTEESPLFRLRVADATGGLSFTVGRFNPGLLPTIEDLSIPSFVTVVGKISTFTSRRGEKVITLNPELIIPSERVERDTWHLIAARDALARIWKLEGRALPGSWLEVPPPAEPRGGEEVSELADSIVRDTLMSIDRTRFLKEIEMIRAGERHTVNDEEDSLEQYEDEVIQLITELDKGSGARWDELTDLIEKRRLSRDTVEEVISNLLDKGLLYEPVLGYLKAV